MRPLAPLAAAAFAASCAAPPPLAAAGPARDRLTIVAPAAPGGGWDQTARAMQQVLEREGLVRVVEVLNVSGAAGTIGLAQFMDSYRDDGGALLITGSVMVSATHWNGSPVSVGQATPIARLTNEYLVVAVPAASPHRSMRSLADALRASPGGVSWGGGSAGGTDHVLVGLVAEAVGVDPRRANYIAFSGGGEAVAAVAGGTVTAGVSGYSEFAPHLQSGLLRALAISAPSPVPGLDVPTLAEQGIGVELANWRGVLAPPGISGDARRRLADLVARMARSARWRELLAARGWIDSYQNDEAFAQFLAAERARVARVVSRLRRADGAAPLPGQHVFPVAVWTGAAALAALLLRRRRGRAAAPANTRAVATVAAALLSFLLLLEPLGFIAAACVLFAVAAAAFRRDRIPVVAGLVLAVTVYVAFTRGLDLALPAGAVWPWMP